MTVASELAEIEYAGDGSTVAFAIPFGFSANADIAVSTRDSTGDATPLSTGFTITGAGTGSGTCTFTTAPASGTTVRLERAPEIVQNTDYTANDAFPAEATESALDERTYVDQYLRALIKRCIQVPAGDAAIDDSVVLPSVTSRKGKLLYFDGTTGAIDVLDLTSVSGISSPISQGLLGSTLYPRTAAEIAASVTPTNYAYPEGHMFRYGVPTDGTSDCTAALNKAIAIAAVATSTIRFVFPKIGAAYKFMTKPNTITAPMYIAGEGKVGTALYRDFNGSVDTDALFNLGPTGEGFILEKIQVASVSGRSGGSLISAVGDASTAPGWIQLKDSYLTSTGTNTHAWAVYVDGSLKTGAPVGVRSLFIDGCTIFGGSSGAVFAKSVVAFNAANSQTFQAGGTSGKVKVTGTVGNPSFYFKWSGSTIHGIDATFVNYCEVDVAWISGDIVNDSTAADVFIRGACTGSIQRNCTRGHYHDPGFGIEIHGKPIAAKTSGATTNVGHIGTAFTTSCGNGLTFTITPITAKMFSIATAGGAAALVFADFKSATITLVGNPSSEFEASSTPAAGKTGIFKSANSHVISITNNVGSTVVYDILHLGNVGAVTDPA